MFVYNICRINRKAQLFTKMLKSEFHKVYKVSFDTGTLKIK